MYCYYYIINTPLQNLTHWVSRASNLKTNYFQIEFIQYILTGSKLTIQNNHVEKLNEENENAEVSLSSTSINQF